MASSPWDGAEFFPTKPSVKNVYSSLNFFEDHLRAGEGARAVLLGRDAALILTDHRLLELRPHLDDFGFWNVKSFEGYQVSMDAPLAGTTISSLQDSGAGVLLGLSCPDGHRDALIVPHGGLTRDHIDRFVQMLKVALGRKGF